MIATAGHDSMVDQPGAAPLCDDIGLSNLTITKLARVFGIAPPGVDRHVADLRRAIGQ